MLFIYTLELSRRSSDGDAFNKT